MPNKINYLRALMIFILVTPFFEGVVQNFFFLLITLVSTLIFINYLRNTNFKISMSNKDITAKLFISGLLIVSYAAINMIINGYSTDALIRLLQLYVSFTVLLASSKYMWNISDYKFIIKAIQIIVVVCIVLWPLSGFIMNYYNALFTRGNALGGALFCYMGIYLSIPRKYSKWDKIIIALMLLLMYFANSRSAMVSMVVFLLIRFLFLRHKNWNRKYIILVLVTIFTIFPYVYMMLYQSSFKDSLDAFSWLFLRKRFFSGRQYFWGILIEYINNKFLLGYGLGVTPETLLGITYSSHNWYLQILLQMGLIGFLLLVNVLRNIWNTLSKLGSKISANASAFIVGVLIWQCFEVSLTQNNYSIGILTWLVMGMGLNQHFQPQNNSL